MDTDSAELRAKARLLKEQTDQLYRLAANARKGATQLLAALEDTTAKPTPREDTTNDGNQDQRP
jgi:hypothetical protein